MNRIELPMKKIARQYKEGIAIEDLATLHFTSYYCLWKRLNDLGVINKKRPFSIDRKELAQLYLLELYTIHDLAVKYQATERTIIYTLDKLHIQRRNTGYKNPEINYMTPVTVHFLREIKGMKIREIADRCQVSERTVYNCLNDDISDKIRRSNEQANH